VARTLLTLENESRPSAEQESTLWSVFQLSPVAMTLTTIANGPLVRPH